MSEIEERLAKAKTDYAAGKITIEEYKRIKDEVVAARSALREVEQGPIDGVRIQPETISTGGQVGLEGDE